MRKKKVILGIERLVIQTWSSYKLQENKVHGFYNETTHQALLADIDTNSNIEVVSQVACLVFDDKLS